MRLGRDGNDNDVKVFLVERLDRDGTEPMLHMKAVCFVRPTGENVALLRRHLKNPCYGEFHIFFSNIVKDTHLQELAEADQQEVVSQVQEYFGDYVALEPHHFCVPVENEAVCLQPPTWSLMQSSRVIDRTVEGLAGLMLSLKCRPHIRFQKSSDLCRRISNDLWRHMYETEKELFDYRKGDNTPVLLVVDRLDDPVTPLLTQWTYQAMIHELLGIRFNRVSIKKEGKSSKQEEQEFVVGSEADPFFKTNMYENYGDLGNNVKELVDEFAQDSNQHSSITTVADMQHFVEAYPEFRAKGGHVSKHVTLLTEMSKIVDKRILLSVSQTEQELACSSGLSSAADAVSEALGNPAISDSDKLRLVMLFALRYERDGTRYLSEFIQKLSNLGLPNRKLDLVYTLLRVGGEEKRTGDLFGTKSLRARAVKIARGLKGVENVYTQHAPLLANTMQLLLTGRLRDVDYPFVGPATSHPASNWIPPDVIVFVVGGTTYEESRYVALHNGGTSGTSSQMAGAGTTKFMLGGTSVQNSRSFIAQLAELADMERSKF